MSLLPTREICISSRRCGETRGLRVWSLLMMMMPFGSQGLVILKVLGL